MEAFLASHEMQLYGSGLPTALYPVLYAKLLHSTFDAGHYFQILQKDSDSGAEIEYFSYRLTALQDLQAESNVFLVDHAWTFRLSGMRAALQENAVLRKRMKAIAKFWTNKLDLPGVEYGEEDQGKEYLGAYLQLDGQGLASLEEVPVEESVKMLSLSENQISDLASVVPALGQLYAFWIEDNPVCDSDQKEAELTAFLEANYPNIQMFNRSFTRNAKEWALLYCGNNESPEAITKLNLRGRGLERRGADILRLCPAVTSLDLRDNHYSNHEELLAVLASLPQLQILYIDSLFERFIWQQIDSFPALKRLNNWQVSKGRPKGIDRVCSIIPRIAGHYRMATEDTLDETSVWYVMDELGCAILHSDLPNVKVVPFVHQAEGGETVAYSILWPVAPITAGTIVYRDFLNETKDFRSERLSTLYRLPPKVYIGLFYTWLTQATVPPNVHCLAPPPLQASQPSFRIWTDLGFFRDTLTDPRFVFDDSDHPEILWSHGQIIVDGEWQMKLSEDQYINQFPYEGCIVMKSQLANTVQKHGSCPAWFPRTYDLTKEVSAFLGDYYFREMQGEDNHWIVKPVGMARGMDTWVTSNVDLVIQLMSTGPKVCQKYLETPLLLGGCKFDLRFIVMVQSFEPLRLFVYKRFWVRSANHPFSLVYDQDSDYETHFTVMNYSAHQLQTIMDTDFITRLQTEHNLDWATIQPSVYQSFKELFLLAGIAQPGLQFERSRALYGVDVMLDREGKPQVLEVNFCPDCTRATKQFPSFANDVFACLFYGELNNIDQL